MPYIGRLFAGVAVIFVPKGRDGIEEKKSGGQKEAVGQLYKTMEVGGSTILNTLVEE